MLLWLETVVSALVSHAIYFKTLALGNCGVILCLFLIVLFDVLLSPLLVPVSCYFIMFVCCCPCLTVVLTCIIYLQYFSLRSFVMYVLGIMEYQIRDLMFYAGAIHSICVIEILSTSILFSLRFNGTVKQFPVSICSIFGHYLMVFWLTFCVVILYVV